jgi:subfamily B ATP-binding cassette protein MsbA
VIAAVAVMLYQSVVLSLFVAFLFPLIAVLVRVLGIAFRRYSSRIQDSVGEVTQVTDEVIRGSWVVKAFSGYNYEQSRFHAVDAQNQRQNLKLIRVRALGVAVTPTLWLANRSGIVSRTRSLSGSARSGVAGSISNEATTWSPPRFV